MVRLLYVLNYLNSFKRIHVWANCTESGKYAISKNLLCEIIACCGSFMNVCSVDFCVPWAFCGLLWIALLICQIIILCEMHRAITLFVRCFCVWVVCGWLETYYAQSVHSFRMWCIICSTMRLPFNGQSFSRNPRFNYSTPRCDKWVPLDI